ncbi:unnamed protein product [Calypogeia fissa]
MFEKLLSPRQKLRHRELQVIVKATNYVFQPKEAVYAGTWHVEGMFHEQIIASGIYYYSTSPWLEDHGLQFRRARDFVNDYRAIDPDEENPLEAEAVQILHYNISLGAVPTLQDRLLVFSNELQHKATRPHPRPDQGSPGELGTGLGWAGMDLGPGQDGSGPGREKPRNLGKYISFC